MEWFFEWWLVELNTSGKQVPVADLVRSSIVSFVLTLAQSFIPKKGITTGIVETT